MANEIKFGNKIILVNGNALTLASASSDPVTAANGDIYYNTTSNTYRAYQNGGWVTLSTDAITALTGDVTATGPGSSAATVALVGGVSASNVASGSNLANAATNLNTASTIVKRDSSGNFTAGTITASLTGAASLNVLKSGDTMSGILNMGSNKITSVTDPTSAQDAATKNYVDTHSGTASSALDGTFTINNTSDPTKQIAFSAASITTGTVRTITMPDSNVNLGLIGTALQKDGSVTATGALNMGSHKINNVTDPTSAQDAATKNYVDTTAVLLTAGNAVGGYPVLDAGGKVAYAQLPSALMTFKGAWNASTNTPTLADGTGTNGDVYRASVAGTQNLGSGSQTWAIGDFAIYNGTIWQHSPAADGVSSVNGSTGAVTVNAINQLTGDVTATAASGSQSKATTVAAIQGTTVSGVTGTGNVMFSASPTTTGTLTAAAISASGSISASNFSGSSSGTNTGDQTITLTGDVTGSGTGSFAATVAKIAGVSVGTPTGSGNVVFSASPTLTGTIVAAAANFSGAIGANGGITSTGAMTLQANSGSSSLDIESTKVRRSKDATNYIEQEYLDSLTLTHNTSTSPAGLSFSAAVYGAIEITYYMIQATSGDTRQGVIRIAANNTGTTVSSGDGGYYETSDVQIVSSATISGSTVTVTFANAHATRDVTMRADVKRFRI